MYTTYIFWQCLACIKDAKGDPIGMCVAVPGSTPCSRPSFSPHTLLRFSDLVRPWRQHGRQLEQRRDFFFGTATFTPQMHIHKSHHNKSLRKPLKMNVTGQ